MNDLEFTGHGSGRFGLAFQWTAVLNTATREQGMAFQYPGNCNLYTLFPNNVLLNISTVIRGHQWTALFYIKGP